MLYRETNGLFDPTVQPLWLAYASGRDVAAARAQVGWERINLPTQARRGVRLGAGQLLSFNGIAQGAATDAVRQILKAAGMKRVIVDIGETATLGGPWRIGVADPNSGHLGTVRLEGMALAVSTPTAMRLSGAAHHTRHPHGHFQPRWSSVAVVARRASVADGFSTAGCFMSPSELQSCAT